MAISQILSVDERQQLSDVGLMDADATWGKVLEGDAAAFNSMVTRAEGLSGDELEKFVLAMLMELGYLFIHESSTENQAVTASSMAAFKVSLHAADLAYQAALAQGICGIIGGAMEIGAAAGAGRQIATSFDKFARYEDMRTANKAYKQAKTSEDGIASDLAELQARRAAMPAEGQDGGEAETPAAARARREEREELERDIKVQETRLAEAKQITDKAAGTLIGFLDRRATRNIVNPTGAQLDRSDGALDRGTAATISKNISEHRELNSPKFDKDFVKYRQGEAAKDLAFMGQGALYLMEAMGELAAAEPEKESKAEEARATMLNQATQQALKNLDAMLKVAGDALQVIETSIKSTVETERHIADMIA